MSREIMVLASEEKMMVTQEEFQKALGMAVAPLMAALERSSRALEQMAMQQKVQADRMAALEREMRLSVPVTDAQEKTIQAAVRERACWIAMRYGLCEGGNPLPDKVNRLRRAIRGSLTLRFGVRAIRSIPRAQYDAALAAARIWMDAEMVGNMAIEAENREQKY